MLLLKDFSLSELKLNNIIFSSFDKNFYYFSGYDGEVLHLSSNTRKKECTSYSCNCRKIVLGCVTFNYSYVVSEKEKVLLELGMTLE